MQSKLQRAVSEMRENYRGFTFIMIICSIQYTMSLLVHTYKLSHPASLHEVCDHNHNVNVLFPDEPPEGVKRVWQRALRCDVGPRPLVAVNIVGVDVVCLFLAAARVQWHHGVVVCENGQTHVRLVK